MEHNETVNGFLNEIKQDVQKIPTKAWAEWWDRIGKQIEYQKTIVLASRTSQDNNTLYDPAHSKLTRTEMIGKIMRSIKVKCDMQTNDDGNIDCNVIIYATDDIDMSDPFVADIFDKFCDSVDITTGYDL